MIANRSPGTARLNDSRTRRGVTLVEMLVTVAVLVILMTILVQIFQAATGAVSAAQAYQRLDDQLRRLDGIMRADLEGATARFTPPLDPQQNLGYFEYGENEFADTQGEDSDDYIRFTAKAPPGKPFTGRFWPRNWPLNNPVFGPNGVNASSFPITITSDFAEIIYFVRNGNLYRRVFLVAPQLQSSISLVPSTGQGPTFQPQVFGGQFVSWQGVNDLSARPTGTGATTTTPPTANNAITLNTLGDLTNRENRAFMPRFANDFVNVSGIVAGTVDGVPDDANGDNVPDLYPSLYPNVFGLGLVFSPAYQSNAASLLAFPYVFPGAYSVAQALPNAGYQSGWIHAPAPMANVAGSLTSFDSGPLAYLLNLNHNPLDVGDNLPTPANPPGNTAAMVQTWWGFPTWRETLSQNWVDPTAQVNMTGQQPAGLNPFASLNVAAGALTNPTTDTNVLPPMTLPFNRPALNFSFIRQTPQLFCDGTAGVGESSAFWGGPGYSELGLWIASWEDDLIMTGVRSFDVKVFDNVLANYADLGWGDDLRLYLPYTSAGAIVPGMPPFLSATPSPVQWPPINAVNVPFHDPLTSFMHEGRMPPLSTDLRVDAQYGSVVAGFYANFPNYTGNLGDNQNTTVRLRRVWDSWSTDYSRAPGTGVMPPQQGGSGYPTSNFPIGPPFSPPVYPSYPPPYPAPLRGIQIQVRVVDPSNQRIKSLTIRQDFTDKL